MCLSAVQIQGRIARYRVVILGAVQTDVACYCSLYFHPCVIFLGCSKTLEGMIQWKTHMSFDLDNLVSLPQIFYSSCSEEYSFCPFPISASGWRGSYTSSHPWTVSILGEEIWILSSLEAPPCLKRSIIWLQWQLIAVILPNWMGVEIGVIYPVHRFKHFPWNESTATPFLLPNNI